MTDGDVLLTPGQAAALFCVEVATMRDWANTGRLTVIKTPGGHRRHNRSEVGRLFDEGTDERAGVAAKFGRYARHRALRAGPGLTTSAQPRK